MIKIDGSTGEGGGQILRTSLTLSMVTGLPFSMLNIRSKRSKPGILRQHLVAIRAAAVVCGSEVSGDHLGSTELNFTPGSLKGGNHRFDIGSAGSCTLVLQTLIPALMLAKEPSRIEVCGGTHNPMAPPYEALQRSYGKLIRDIGGDVRIDLNRFGFYPAGGGSIVADIRPTAELRGFPMLDRGPLISKRVESLIASIPAMIADKELTHIRDATGWDQSTFSTVPISKADGSGNALIATLEFQNSTEVFWCPGQKRVSSEQIAQGVLDQIQDYVSAEGAFWGEHMADQVMLPLALAGGGSFTTTVFTDHSMTNADVIEKFLPVAINLTANGKTHLCTITKRTTS